MDFPKRTKQKQSEALSYAILLYKLRNIGIFRNVTDSDYGVDFEIELVLDGCVTGRYIKAQVKSADTINVRQSDNVPTVSNIKQSTLAYWCELSYRSHVIAYAVDLKSEEVFVSKPLFWQATTLFDDTEKTKTIEFLPSTGAMNAEDVAAISVSTALSPSVPEFLFAHTSALRNIKRYLGMYADAMGYDPVTPLDEQELFRSFLEVCNTLLIDRVSRADADKWGLICSHDHWVRESGGDEVISLVAREPLKTLLSMLVKEMHELRERVLQGVRWWRYRDVQYLRLVYDTPLPLTWDAQTLIRWGERHDELARAPQTHFDLFLSDLDRK